jgi:prephenate dehydrogenase
MRHNGEKMPVQLTIIGLGYIGTSFGLALGARNDLIRRVGHDKAPEAGARAQKLRAIDALERNLPAAVRGADIVLLALPQSAAHETLQYILPDLKPGAVVMDTSPAKAWLAQIPLPDLCAYIGLLPTVNAAHFDNAKAGADAARADLFHNTVMGIAAPLGTSGEAIKLAADLTTLVGATPLYVDMTEADSLMAAVHWLPQALSAALTHATVGQPGWREAQKLAGRSYYHVSAPLGYADTGLGAVGIYSREHVLRALDSSLAVLTELRELIVRGDEQALNDFFAHASTGGDAWLGARLTANWQEGAPRTETESTGGWLSQWFLGRGKK